MKKTIFLSLFIIVFGIFVGYLVFKINKLQPQAVEENSGDVKIVEDKNFIEVKPWVEVLRDQVFVSNSNGDRSLQTGDEVIAGDIVKTGDTGVANIYFPDGSVARLDSKTQITISEASYNPENQSLVVKILLSAGRVWSKIIELATPDSSWEVETTDAVATVRGTAFSVEFDGVKTNILGSENTVGVRLKERGTKSLVGEEAIVSPGNYLLIDQGITKSVGLKRIKLNSLVKRTPVDIGDKTWHKRAIFFDGELNKVLTPSIRKDLSPIQIKNVLLQMIQTEAVINSTTIRYLLQDAVIAPGGVIKTVPQTSVELLNQTPSESVTNQTLNTTSAGTAPTNNQTTPIYDATGSGTTYPPDTTQTTGSNSATGATSPAAAGTATTGATTSSGSGNTSTTTTISPILISPIYTNLVPLQTSTSTNTTNLIR